MSYRQAYCIDNAHGQLVRDLDFNPNRQYYLASCSDDCLAKFWDIRNVGEPVKVLSDHSHWFVFPFLLFLLLLLNYSYYYYINDKISLP